MENAIPNVCPHGHVVSWQGLARFGDILPEIEHCEQCNPGAVKLAPPMVSA